MNSKITLPELVTLLAEKTGLSKRQCEGFVKSFFGAVSASLVAHDNVKIKGLGTFKLTEIDSRKSVNVNTGEEIEIAGHYRVTFVAEKGLAELINHPFEAFETVELGENVTEEMLDEAIRDEVEEEVSPDTRQPEENIVETEESSINNSDQLPETDEPLPIEEPIYFIDDEIIEPCNVSEEAENLQKIAHAAEFEEEEDADISETVVIPENINEPVNNEDAAKNEVTEEHLTIAPPPIPDNHPEKIEKAIPETNRPKIIEATEEQHHRRVFGYGFIIGMLSCILVLGVAFTIWYTNQQKTIVAESEETDTTEVLLTIENDSIANDTLSSITPTQSVANETDSLSPDTVKNVDKIEPKEVTEDKTVATKPSDIPKYDTIRKDRFLTTMAKAYYGNYHLWPYIYEANKGLGHPDRIRPGTKILIPDITKQGIDPKDPAVIANAKRKGTAIYAKYKK